MKKEKEILADFDCKYKEVRSQLVEQLRCMELKVDADTAVLAEIQDFYRRRAAIEQDYSDQLNKLVTTLKSKHRAEQSKRQNWPNYTTLTLWNTLVAGTIRVSQAHSVTSNVFAKQMVQRLQDMQEDAQRLFRKCREIAFSCQEALLEDTALLQERMKTYHAKHNDALYAEAKYNQVKNQKCKLEEHLNSKGTNPLDNKKYKQISEQNIRKFQKYQKAKKETTKARNSYLLELIATNSGVQKYFSDNIPDILDCMACGYHNGLARSTMMHLSCEESLQSVHESLIELLNRNVAELNSRKDKQLFLEKYQSAFRLGHLFQFLSHKDDDENQLNASSSVRSHLESNRAGFKTELDELKTKTEEDWKTLEAVEKSLMSLINQKDYDVTAIFKEHHAFGRGQAKDSVTSGSSTDSEDRAKMRQNRVEQEEYYLSRFNAYLIDMYRFHTRQAKYQAVQKVLGNEHRGADLPKKLPRRVIRVPMVGKPKLFGGTIDEYVEATKEEIPPIILSCIRVLNQYGMHHQGVFRVPGSQAEINDFKASFERGEDPLVDVCDARDINSTAGLLKLYFRELGEPVFPSALFDEFVECTTLGSVDLCVERLRKMVSELLSRPVYVVMRYLFAFLNHLAEMSDDNMMDTYNLAICFGPTLMPVPAERNQVQYQNSVNELIKTIIIHHNRIFDSEVPGPLYERNPTIRPRVDSSRDDEIDDIDQSVIEDPTWDEEDLRSTSESDGTPLSERRCQCYLLSNQPLSSSLNDAEVTHAIAQHDYVGRSHRELSFKKNEALFLYRRLNADWWEGRSAERVTGAPPREGLIPEAYVTVLQAQTPNTPPPAGGSDLSSSGGATASPQPPPEGSGPERSGSPDEEEEEDELENSLTAAAGAESDEDSLERDLDGNLEPTDADGDVPPVPPVREGSGGPHLTLPMPPAPNDMAERAKTLPIMDSVADLLRRQNHALGLSNTETPVAQGAPAGATSSSVASFVGAPSSSSFSSFSKPSSSSTDDLGQRRVPLLTRRASDGPVYRTATLPPPPPLEEDPAGEAAAEVEDDFVDDLDVQLQKVMDGLASLEHNSLTIRASHTMDRAAELEQKLTLPTAKHTPDLVLDLPARSPSSSSLGSTSPLGPASADGAPSTAADTFAEQGGDTLKKSTKTVVMPSSEAPTAVVMAAAAAAAAATASDPPADAGSCENRRPLPPVPPVAEPSEHQEGLTLPPPPPSAAPPPLVTRPAIAKPKPPPVAPKPGKPRMK